MEALKIKAFAHHRILFIEVPEEFNEKELEVTILPAIAKSPVSIEEEKELKHQERVNRLMNVVGAAKFPDVPLTKYDVYEQ